MGGKAVAIGQRLKHARERAGLSLSQVRERTGLGDSSLSDFENDKREPSLSQLTLMAKCYRRSVAFFLSTESLPEQVVLWRERPEAGAEELEATFLRLCEQYRKLESWCDAKTTVELPYLQDRPASLDYSHADELAKKVRKELELGETPGVALARVLEEACGLKLFYAEFEPTGTAACSMNDDFGAAVLLNSKNAPWRRNFDLAHELFHLLTWPALRSSNPNAVCSTDEERLANVFASNLLMPTDAVRTAVRARLVDGKLPLSAAFEIARQFDVSVEALIWRIHDLFGGAAAHRAKTKAVVEAARSQAAVLERRERVPVPSRPARFQALAVTALRRGEISIGRFAEYMGISRHQAMTFAEQEPAGDEAIELASA